MSTFKRIARALPLVLPLALVAPMTLAGPMDAAAEDSEEKTYDYGAKVKIELRMEDGTVVKHRAEMRTLGTEWRYEFDGADHHHVVTLTANGEEGDKKLKVELAYERDAEDMIQPYKDTYPVRKRQSLWTADGRVAVALTFIPTKFEREDQSRDDKDKIDPGGGDDPLGGNLFN